MILLVGLALGADRSRIEADLHVLAGIGARPDIPTLLGGGGSIAWAPLSRFHLELGVDGGARLGGGGWSGVGPRARFFIAPPEQTTISLFAGGGVAIEPGTPGFVSLGAAVEPLRSPAPRPRLQFDYLLSPAGESRGLLSLGIVVGRRGPPEPEPEPEPYEPMDVNGMVWVPGPVCQWLSDDDANAALEAMQWQLESVNVLNDETFGGPSPDEDRAPPAQLVVAASPGDVVTVDGRPLSVKKGYGVGAYPEGRVDVRIEGGGRVLDWPVGLATGNVVWLTVDDPEPMKIQFGLGSQVVTEEAREALEAWVEHAGDWEVAIHGSASPEGTEDANRALAKGRARAVAAALVAAGFPSRKIRVGPSRPYPDLSPEEQRAAFVEAVP